MTKQEQARWDEVREKMWTIIADAMLGDFNEGDLDLLVDKALEIEGLVVLHPEQELPKNLYASERDFKVCFGVQQEMLRRGWKRVIGGSE